MRYAYDMQHSAFDMQTFSIHYANIQVEVCEKHVSTLRVAWKVAGWWLSEACESDVC